MYTIYVVTLFSILLAEDIRHFSQPVLDAYIKYCGIEKTCNLDKQFDKYAHKSIALLEQCHACICDTRQCTYRYRCCPDVILPRVSTEDFEDWNLKHFSISVIDKCPANANSTLVEMCSKNWSDIADEEFYVVYYFDSNSRDIEVYKNKYCAVCNDIQTWKTPNFLLFCKEYGFPLNVYSSKEAFLSAASKYGCRIDIEYIGTSIGTLINSCNATGKWDKENADMEWACQYYETVPYLSFKNIFCYMCNTGLSAKKPYIDSCISHMDAAVEHMCLSEDVDTRFYPFKNQYCRSCNILSPPGTEDFKADIAPGPFKENGAVNWIVRTDPHLCYIRHLDMYNFLKISTLMDSLCNEKVLVGEKRISLQKEFDGRYQSSITRRQSRFMNITLIFEKLRPITPLCSSSMVNRSRICSCNMNCFSKGNCCPDMVILSNESSCTDFASYSPSIYTKCKSPISDKILQYYCERKDDEYESLIDFVPFYDRKDQVYYKNVFCKICSKPKEDIFSNGYLISAYIECKEFIDVENYLRNGKSVIELNDICDVEHLINTGTMLQPADHQCPQNFNKAISPADLLYLCTWAGSFVYSTCKSKYKNVFCQMHHMEQERTIETSELTLQYMQIFWCNVTDDEQEATHEKYPLKFTFNPAASRRSRTIHTSGNYKSDDFYDEKHLKRRVIKCIQGKFFFNGKCVPLLRNTSVLGYHAEMIATVMNPAMDGTKSTENIVTRLLHNFKRTLYNFSFKIFIYSGITIMAPAPCNSSWNGLMNTEEMQELLFDIKIDIDHMFPRQQLDEFLLETMSRTFKIDVYGIEFQVSMSNIDLYGNWLKRNQLHYCFIPRPSYYRGMPRMPHYFEIDKFLVCPQIAFEKGEYQLVNSRMLNVPKLGHQIQMPYTLGSDNQVLICLSDYLALASLAPPLKSVSSAMFFLILRLLFLQRNFTG